MIHYRWEEKAGSRVGGTTIPVPHAMNKLAWFTSSTNWTLMLHPLTPQSVILGGSTSTMRDIGFAAFGNHHAIVMAFAARRLQIDAAKLRSCFI